MKVQHVPLTEEVKKAKINRIRNGCFLDTLVLVDIQEIVEAGGKKLEIGSVIYRENSEINPFRTVIKIFFKLKKYWKDGFCWGDAISSWINNDFFIRRANM